MYEYVCMALDGEQPWVVSDSSLPLKVKDELLELSKDKSTIQANIFTYKYDKTLYRFFSILSRFVTTAAKNQRRIETNHTRELACVKIRRR